MDKIQVRKGEILGIAGLMGSGRTEIARCIFGADKADSKELFMDGKPITVNSPGQAIALGIGYATEDRKFDGLALGLDVQYNTNMAHLKQLSHFGIIDDKEANRNAQEYKELLRNSYT